MEFELKAIQLSSSCDNERNRTKLSLTRLAYMTRVVTSLLLQLLFRKVGLRRSYG